MAETTKEYCNRRQMAMKDERFSFDSHWREIAQFMQPRLGRFFTQDRNCGDKRYQSIINNQATRSVRAAQAGMMAGVMSPARKWFNLETPDPDLMEYAPVTEWMYKVELIMNAIFQASNLYGMAPMALRELLLFGTASMVQVSDFNSVTRFYTNTIGSYTLAQNDRFEIDTQAYEFEMTVRQLVAKYGLDNVSKNVKSLWDQSNYESWVPVVRFIEPNPVADPRKPGAASKRWRSVHYEPGDDRNKILLTSGFDDFPIVAPRWDVTGEDIYATDCPGMTALGDTKALQILEKRTAQAIDKAGNPPLTGPPTLRNVPVSSMPGGLTLYDPQGGQADGLRPIYMVNPHTQEYLLKTEHHESRIKAAFYEDLFRSIDSMEGVQPQNQLFLSMKNAEKLLQLGPVLERLHGEMLNKIIDRTFNLCLKANLLPPPPQELQGKPLRVRYISTLAAAQREVATNGIDKLTMYIGGLMQMGKQDAMDKFDSDQAIDEYARAIGVPPRLVVPDEQVVQVRQQRAQMQKAQAAAEMAQQGGQAVQSLANSPTGQPDGGNVLQQLSQAMAQRAGAK